MTGPKPSGPTHPTPTGPPKDADDAIFTTVGELYADLARPHKPRPPSKPPRKPTQTKPIRGTHCADWRRASPPWRRRRTPMSA